MKKLLKLVSLVLLSSVILLSSGCASYMVYKNSEEKVALRKASVMPNKEEAIMAVRLDGGAGVGIDVSNLEALKEQPILQFLAAVVDAGVILGAKDIIEGLNETPQGVNVTLTDSTGNTITIDTSSTSTETTTSTTTSTTTDTTTDSYNSEVETELEIVN